MSDLTTVRRSPLADIGLVSDVCEITIEDTGAAARFVLRGGAVVAVKVGVALGLNFPRESSRSVHHDGIAALWLGPDEWLLLGRAEEESNLQYRLCTALALIPHSLVSVGHRDAAFIVRGRKVTDAINAGCPLDLSISAFPIDACTRTLLGKAEIILWRLDTNAFRIEVARSFAPYVHALLTIAAHEGWSA